MTSAELSHLLGALTRAAPFTLQTCLKTDDGLGEAESVNDPADFWISFSAGHSVERAVGHLFSSIGSLYHRRGSSGDLDTLWRMGHKIALSTQESAQLRGAAQQLKGGEFNGLLTSLGAFSYGGEGRRFRMELLAALWLVTYFNGCRNDSMAAGLLRLATVQAAMPYGLSFWVALGLLFDEERFDQSQLVTRGDIYSVRKKPVQLFGDDSVIVDPASKALQLLGQLYGQFQVALTLRSLAENRTGSKFYLLYSEALLNRLGYSSQDEQKRFKAWEQAGLVIRDVPDEKLDEIGSGFFGTRLGLGYIGRDLSASTAIEVEDSQKGYSEVASAVEHELPSDDSSFEQAEGDFSPTPKKNQGVGRENIEYRCFRIEKESLTQRRKLVQGVITTLRGGEQSQDI